MADQVNKKSGAFLSLAFVRNLLVVLVLVILAWKLSTATFVIDMDKFGFAEVLAILLAFFAIGLSVAFYFKATETSNTFYDNVYHFTKDTSEILGRIEAGFGERLRHLDEGYSGLRDRVEQIPFDLNGAKEEAKKEEEEVKRKEAERDEMINNLAERAKLAENEKEQILTDLKGREREILRTRRELLRLRRKIDSAEPFEGVPDRLTDFIVNQMPWVIDGGFRRAPSVLVRKRFASEISDMPAVTQDLLDAELIDDDHDLTKKGFHYLRELADRHGR